MLLAAALLSGVAAVAEDEPPQKVREILVPFQDLNVLLENQPRRVLLSRREYDDLVRRAKVVPVQRAPRPFVVAAADYSGTSDGQRVRLTGELTIDVLDEGLDAVPLDLGWVGLLEAKLDGRDAPLGRDPAGQICLLVEGVGRHKLALEMAAPLETAAAQQTFSIRLPREAQADCGWSCPATWSSAAARPSLTARWTGPPASPASNSCPPSATPHWSSR